MLVFILWAWGSYIAKHSGDFTLMSELSLPALASMITISLVLSVFYAYQLKIATDYLGPNLGFFEWFGLYRLTLLANISLPLASGAVVKAAYLKRYHNVTLKSFLAVTGSSIVVRLGTHALAALVLLFFANELHTPLGAGALLMLIATIVVHLSSRYVPSFPWLGEQLTLLAGEWQRVCHHPRTLLRFVWTNALIISGSTLRLWAAFNCFGEKVSLLSCGIIASFSVLSRILNLTPGNLGLRESIVAGVAGVLGTPLNAGLHAAALERIVETVLSLVFGLPFIGKLAGKEGANGAKA